jgi:hypothetical protein
MGEGTADTATGAGSEIQKTSAKASQVHQWPKANLLPETRLQVSRKATVDCRQSFDIPTTLLNLTLFLL